MQATVAPARTAPAGEGKQKPSLLSTLSLVRRGGDLFAKSKASSPTSCSTLLPSPSQSPATFVLLDALTLKLRSTLIVRDDRDSDTSIDLESEGELEELHEQLVATIEEGKQALEERTEHLAQATSTAQHDPEIIERLRLENEQLAAKLRELENVSLEYKSVLDQLKVAQSTVEAQAALIKEQSLVNHELFLVNDGLKNQLAESEAGKEAALREVDALSKGIKVLQETVEAQRAESERKDAELAVRKEEAEKMREELAALRDELANTRSRDEREIVEYKDQIDGLQAEIAKLREALDEEKYKEERREIMAPSLWS